MFPYEEFVTLLSALVLVASGFLVYSRYNRVPGLLWLVGSLSFLAVSLALALRGLEALELAVAPLLGSIYPAFIASAVVWSLTRYGRHYLAFAVIMLLLITVGAAFDVGPLRGASHGLLHTASGLAIILLPLHAYYRGSSHGWSLAVSLGGIVISIGGASLAAIAVGVEVLPLELVTFILHPVLFTSAFLLAAGFYYSQGLRV